MGKHFYGRLSAGKRLLRWLSMLTAIMLLLAAVPAAAENRTHLRVGFYAYDGYHSIAEDGARSGYGYDLLQLMSRYANVDYSYHGYESSLEENMQMLQRGEIDLLTSIKWTEQRAENFDFSERSIGSASTVLTVKPGNTSIISGDYATYDGIRIGFLKDSPRIEEIAAYAQEKGFTYQSVYYDTTAALAEALHNGEVDALASTSLRMVKNEWIIDSFNEAPIYVIVRKGDTETLQLVNHILDRMEIEEINWRHELQHKYHHSGQSSIPLLTQEERAYLARQQEAGYVYQVLVNPDRYPYSYIQDGKMVGIMVDLFDLIAQRAGIQYEWILPADREDYAQRMQKGESDICIDMTPDPYQAETHGYTITDTYLTAPFSWVRRDDASGDIKLAAKLVYMAYTPAQYAYENAYHQIDYRTYPSHEECVASVLSGETDGYCTYTYRAEQMVLNDPSGRLVASSSHLSNEFAIGITRKNDILLTTILNTTVDCIEDWERIAITRKHTSFQQPEHSALELIFNNQQIGTLAVTTVIALILLGLLIAQQLQYQKALRTTIHHQNVRLDEGLQGMLSVLATAIEHRSNEAGNHVQRISGLTQLMLRQLKELYPDQFDLAEDQIDQISTAAVLHDVGKIAVPDYVLNKPGRLTAEEFEIIKGHPVKGCELLERIPNLKDEPLYSYAWDICRWHHERWDGRGYPDGLKGEAIPIWAQVAAVADVFDALTHPRVYKKAYSRETAMNMIVNGECGLFNPQVIEAFTRVLPTLAPPEEEIVEDFPEAPASRDLNSLLITAFNSLLNTTDDMIYLKDVDLIYRAVSPAFAKYFGRAPEEIVCRNDTQLFDDELLAHRSIADSRELLASGQNQIDNLEIFGERDGMPVYMSTSKYLLTDSQGRIMGILGILRDVTSDFYTKQHHQIEMKKLLFLEEDVFFTVCIDMISWHIVTEKRQEIDGILFPIHDTVSVLADNAAHNMADRRGAAYSFYQNFTADNLKAIYQSGRSELVMEYKRNISDTQTRWVRDEIKFLVDPHNGHLCAILTVRDIQARKDAERQMIERAERDPLTGLLNRNSSEELIKKAMAESTPDTLHALFMIDVDYFKDVNDKLGHREGDKCLVETARLLQDSFRATDLIARMGGDEFAVFMRNASTREAVEKKAEQLLQALNRMVGPEKSFRVTGSIGISFYPANGTTLDELYEKADQAMYQSKRAGRNRITFVE